MKKKRINIFSKIACIILMIILIFDSKNAIEGAKDGIILCIYTVLPTLFPFCVLSIIFRSMTSNRSLSVFRTIEHLCGMPDGCGTIFLLGLMGGYPIGAICIEDAVKEGCLKSQDAKYLRAVCNNAGPSFIIGMMSGIFQQKIAAFILIIIQALSALLTCMLICDQSDKKIRILTHKNITLTAAIKQACNSMSGVCGIIIIFRTFINVVNKHLSSLILTEIWVPFVGILELTNGVSMLSHLTNREYMFILAAGMISFGGICVAIQTITISAPDTGKHYIICKACQGIIAILLSYVYIKTGVLFVLLYFMLFMFIRIIILESKNKYKITKNSRNSDLNTV